MTNATVTSPADIDITDAISFSNVLQEANRTDLAVGLLKTVANEKQGQEVQMQDYLPLFQRWQELGKPKAGSSQFDELMDYISTYKGS